MGQQLNKQSDDVASSKSKNQRNSRSKQNSQANLEFSLEQEQELELELEQELEQPTQQLPATINLQIAETGETVKPIVEEAEFLAEVGRLLIQYKIQLVEMDNGNDNSEVEQQQQQQKLPLSVEGATTSADALNANEKIVNVKLGAAAGGVTSTGASRTAGSSTEAPKTGERQLVVNNNNLAGIVASASPSTSQSAAANTLKLHDGNEDIESEMATSSLLRRRRSGSASSGSSNSNEGVEYCEVLEPQPVNEMLSNGAQRAQAPNSSSSSNSGCSRCRSSKSAAPATASTSKRRCCKCKFFDACRGVRLKLESSMSSGSSSAAKDKKETVAAAAAPRSKPRSSADRRSTPPTLNAGSSNTAAAAAASATRLLHAQRQRNSVAVAEPSTLGIWAAPAAIGQGDWYPSYAQGDVIIHICSQPRSQFVVEPAAVVASNSAATNATSVVRLVATTAPEPAAAVLPVAIEATPRPAVNSYGAGVTVHSQIDFMHCLVPDLERIINSSFYWGKMDRYEAERLLDGKPEGTFLLRDSAQEEFLFSVTFRKYGRSLHARIEQSGHKFSFDCHDPCVFAALTVTGLLEHYKDPSCVMFFEPCLTMPLHRRETFSLKQLARATIVSNTTYDGINQLALPGSLMSYLKEYHYKQKLRVKPCDVHTPTPFYTNI